MDWTISSNMCSLNGVMFSYPAIRSIGRDIKFTVAFFILYVRLRISQPGLYRSAWNFARWFGLTSDRFPHIFGDSPRDGRVMGVNRGHMAGYFIYKWQRATSATNMSYSTSNICFLLKHLFICLLTHSGVHCRLYTQCRCITSRWWWWWWWWS